MAYNKLNVNEKVVLLCRLFFVTTLDYPYFITHVKNQFYSPFPSCMVNKGSFGHLEFSATFPLSFCLMRRRDHLFGKNVHGEIM